jgi:hypothetical protein
MTAVSELIGRQRRPIEQPSHDGGITWSERCNNGATGLVAQVGSCPGGGYPTSLVATTQSQMEMGLGYVRLILA